MDTHFTVYVYIYPVVCIDCNSLSSTVGKRLKATETEQSSKDLEKEGKEAVKEMCQETPEDGKKALMEKPEAKRGGRKRKEENETEEVEKRKKTKQDKETESKKEADTEMRRITDNEEKKETKQRQGMRGVRGRRGRGPGTRTREWIEKQRATEVTERTVGKKRGWKRKAKGAPGEEVETKLRDEDEERERGEASQADDKDIKKKRKDEPEEEKEEDIQIDDDRLETEMSKKKEARLVDNEVKSSFTLRTYLVQNNFNDKMLMNIFLWLIRSSCKCAAAAPPGSKEG